MCQRRCAPCFRVCVWHHRSGRVDHFRVWIAAMITSPAAVEHHGSGIGLSPFCQTQASRKSCAIVSKTPALSQRCIS